MPEAVGISTPSGGKGSHDTHSIGCSGDRLKCPMQLSGCQHGEDVLLFQPTGHRRDCDRAGGKGFPCSGEERRKSFMCPSCCH